MFPAGDNILRYRLVLSGLGWNDSGNFRAGGEPLHGCMPSGYLDHIVDIEGLKFYPLRFK